MWLNQDLWADVQTQNSFLPELRSSAGCILAAYGLVVSVWTLTFEPFNQTSGELNEIHTIKSILIGNLNNKYIKTSKKHPGKIWLKLNKYINKSGLTIKYISNYMYNRMKCKL